MISDVQSLTHQPSHNPNPAAATLERNGIAAGDGADFGSRLSVKRGSNDESGEDGELHGDG
jgi:hypothetical protein